MHTYIALEYDEKRSRSAKLWVYSDSALKHTSTCT